MIGKADIVFSRGVKGKTVLDNGAWDGCFSFEAEKRGAARVLATDHFCCSGPGWANQDGFLLARELLGSSVVDKDIDIPLISPATVGKHDVVLFMGILYHVFDLLTYLQIAKSVTKEYTVIETALDLESVDRPALSFVRGKWCEERRDSIPLANDPTNFFGPHHHAILAMCDFLGYTRTEYHLVDGRGFFWAYV